MSLQQPAQRMRPFHRLTLAILMLVSLVASLVSTALAWNIAASAVPTGNTGFLTYPAAAVDSAGYVHVTYLVANENFSVNSLFYIRGQITNNGTSVNWESPQALNATNVRSTRPPAITVDNNGVVHIIYGTTEEAYRYARNPQRGATGNWQYELIASVGTISAFQPAIAVDNDGTPYVAWGEGFGDGSSRIVFSYRTGANTWTGRIDATTRYNLARFPNIAVIGNGASAVIHITADVKVNESDRTLKVVYSRGGRTGSFGSSVISDALGDTSGADGSAMTVDPATNKVFVSYVTGNATSGYVTKFTLSDDGGASFRGPPASLSLGTSIWPGYQRLANNGTLVHIYNEQKTWNGSSFTRVDIYNRTYTIASGVFSNFVQISSPSDLVNRGPLAGIASVSDFSAWMLNFTGNVYYNIQPGAGPAEKPDATPVFADGKSLISATPPTINVKFTDIKGSANKALYWWDSPNPTFLTTDVSENPVAIDLPTLDTDGCTNTNFNTRAYRGDILADDQRSLPLTIDSTVQSTPSIGNPNTPNKLPTFGALQSTGPSSDIGGSEGASNGDPRYTRFPLFYMQLVGSNECSNLQDFGVAKRGQTPTSFVGITNNLYSGTPTLPDSVATPQGNVLMTVRVRDSVGNSKDFDTSIIYDSNDPTLSTGNLTFTINPSSTILLNLDFSNIKVTDSYPGGFWGVWVANSLNPIEDPVNDDTINWSAVQVPGAPSNFTLRWSLATDIPRNAQTAGPYYVYVRFLDGAGNPTSDALSVEVRLPARPTYIPTYLPGLVRQ